MPAGPLGPSKAMAQEFPCRKSFKARRISRVFSELDPRMTLYPRSRAIWARMSPSVLGEIKATSPDFRKAAVAAKRSACHRASTPGTDISTEFPQEIRNDRSQSSMILQKKRLFSGSLGVIILENKKIFPIIAVTWRRTQVGKGRVCKTLIPRFESGRCL